MPHSENKIKIKCTVEQREILKKAFSSTVCCFPSIDCTHMSCTECVNRNFLFIVNKCSECDHAQVCKHRSNNTESCCWFKKANPGTPESK